MPEIPIEQAIYGGQDAGGYRFLARSSGFSAEWLPHAELLCAGFGERPTGITCPACVFAQPFGKHHVAVVQVADQGSDDTGRPGALGFRLLIIPRPAYNTLMGDPFTVAERFPPPWHLRGELPVLSWSVAQPQRRTVEEVQTVLKRLEGPTLLGGVQALVDGGRLVFERQAPDTALLQGLWTLLPSSTRCELWPASFAFDNTLKFDALVVPRAAREDYADYVNEEQAEYYPQGSYEFNLQTAAEAGDQEELDALFARRSRSQIWRLGLILLGVMVVLAISARFLAPPAAKKRPPATPPATRESPAAKPGAAIEILNFGPK